MIVVLSNSLGFHSKTPRWLEFSHMTEDQVYPRVLGDLLGTNVVAYAERWLTVKDARSRARRIPSARPDVFILHVGIVESLPRMYPILVRRMVNRCPVRGIRRKLNNLESMLLLVTKKQSSWISTSDFRKYLKETVGIVRERFNPGMIIMVNIFHVNQFIETKRPGTNRNVGILNSVIKELSVELGTSYLDADSVFDDSLFLSDRVHMNAEGHAVMADFLKEAIQHDRAVVPGKEAVTS